MTLIKKILNVERLGPLNPCHPCTYRRAYCLVESRFVLFILLAVSPPPVLEAPVLVPVVVVPPPTDCKPPGLLGVDSVVPCGATVSLLLLIFGLLSPQLQSPAIIVVIKRMRFIMIGFESEVICRLTAISILQPFLPTVKTCSLL